ncbi:TrmH family RNA methyltransferase [Bifidobacterium psychraerophilum]|uniref:TrmH family RNA methyltransferase n=1 Tax=Bifidobacterium psychraerophilum TaxID=218140 RepID=A0A087CGY6_9BIFI|nr:RNA methyltransferase [Bifidobacterium psychraerophilum]KFI82536.1 TrmH family RNA methyltransferase [Bifidobacterium psychraerophilum]PKA95336.1 TrmH family RNA methyltransferase [Bifidobacterium psychraerophilum DSM 22366]
MPIHSGIIDNPKADRIRKVSDLSSRKRREEYGRFCIEGPQAVREAIAYRPEIIGDLFVEVRAGGQAQGEQAQGEQAQTEQARPLSTVVERLEADSQAYDIYVHHVTSRVMQRISTDSQGIVAVADLAAMRVDAEDVPLAEGATVAAFWQIRDPGNAGTVIRAADAAGCDAVVFVDDCVDVLNPKVVRSSVGSLFHIPVLTMSTREFMQWTKSIHAKVVAADVYGLEGRPAMPLPEYIQQGELDGVQPHAFLFGNEARGLPESILKQVDRSVCIPMYGKAESLNLATSAAILLHTVAMSSHIERI